MSATNPPQRGGTTRRRALTALAGMPLLNARARAPIRLIVPFAPAGPSDVAARIVADALAASLGRAIVVDNRPDAGGSLGAEEAAHAAPDVLTLVWTQAATPGPAPSLQQRLGHDASQGLTPVLPLVSEPLVIVAHPDFAAGDVPSLIAAAQARPGRVRYGSGGDGSTPHLAGQLFAWLSESSLLHVPCKGHAAALAEAMAGRVDIVFDGLDSAVDNVGSGRLKALGVTGRERTPLLPQVAPVAQTLPDYEVTNWGGIAAPVGTPPDVIERLAGALQVIGARPEVQRRLAALGMQPGPAVGRVQ